MASYNFVVGNEEVIQQLNELFGSTLNLDIIRSVAKSCKFDVEQSSNHLLEISNQSGFQPRPSPTRNHYNVNSVIVPDGTRKSRKATDIENAIKRINSGYKVLIILRGLSGSGKSTLAKTILKHTIGYDSETAKQHILSTDDFFMKNGVYQYDTSQVPEAHGWNHQRAFNVMSKGYSPVIIDNTNTQMWEMKPYAIMATDYGYYLEILEPDTHWCFNEKELAKRNTHGVPRSTIANMTDRYERNVTPMKLLTAYDCKYKLQKPPQFRLYPPLSNGRITPVLFSFDKAKPESPLNGAIFNGTSLSKSSPFSTKSPTPIETINLMDFDETESSATSSELTKIQNTTGATKSKSENNLTVDKMLMSIEDPLLKSTILKPMQPTKLKQSTSLFDNQNAWGVDESALRSWDIVTPINETRKEEVEVYEIEDDDKPGAETSEVSTSTDNEDFSVLKHVLNYRSSDNIRILDTCNRDINRNVPAKPQGVTRKLKLDKSCLTEDYFQDQNVHIDHLRHVFPNVSVKTLKYWYNKCNRDFECTIELLLSEREELINVMIEEGPVESEPESLIVQEPIVIDSDSGSSCASETPQLSPNKNSKHKRKNNSSSSDECKELKKCIESKVTISDDYYSEKLLKIRQHKFGLPSSSTSPEPGTSSAVEPASSPKEFLSDMDISECCSELDGVEWEETSPEQNVDDNGESIEFGDVETVELNLGEHFVKQLEDHFGDPNLLYPKGFQPVVQVPVALARQLYTFYIESVYQQMEAQNVVLEALVKEDEEFARKLQENEAQALKSAVIQEQNTVQSEPTEIPDIMREQRELSKRKKEADKWKELTPDTLAAKLTKEKLFGVFPSLDRDTLVEILHAHGNVYNETLETLLASTNIQDVRGDIDVIRAPPIDKATISEMWEAHDSCKDAETENELQSAESYREEANRLLKKRADLYDKARRYYQTGMTEVAQFYSGLASQQTRWYEKANSFAASAFLDEHSKRLQDFNTLDLHFLYVKEAIPSLDMFLDRNINLLRLSTSKQTEYLQIITGRGKNSENGIAKIRPAVINRLKQRKIRFQQLNPGLLKIKINNNSMVTSDL